MNQPEYRHALHLLDRALAMIDHRVRRRQIVIQRKLRRISLELDLLRSSWRQPPASWQRN